MLEEVYTLCIPSVRRFPQLYWARLRQDMDLLLVERGPGLLVQWHHDVVKRFFIKRYLSDKNELQRTHDMLAQYFGGRWHNNQKPFAYSSAFLKIHKTSKEGVFVGD